MSPPVRVALFSWSAPTSCISLAELPGSLSVGEANDFFAWAANVEFDRLKDTLILYEQDTYFEQPAATPLLAATLIESLPQSTVLYVRVVKGFTKEVAKTKAVITVQVSLDGRTIAGSTDVFVTKPPNLRRIVAVATGPLLPDGYKFDLYLVKSNGMMVALGSRSVIQDGCTVRFDPVQGRNRNLSSRERLIQVAPACVGPHEYLAVSGVPFFMKVDASATLADVSDEVLAAVAPGGEAAKKVKFFLGHDWVRYAPKSALRDTDAVYREGTALYVVLKPKAPVPARRSEEVLKIDN
jgi:hypothetical protein